MKTKVLVTDRFAVPAWGLLRANSNIDALQGTPENMLSHLAEVEVLIIRSRTKIDSAYLDQAPKLKLIITSTSGYDHVDLEETQKRKITVTHTPDANAQSTAELTWLLILATARQIQLAQKMLSTQAWDRKSLNGVELSGKTLGIVGLGRVGSRVAKIAKAFDMKVLAYDPYKDDTEFTELGVGRVGYTELLRLSHLVTYHVPYTTETHRMLNRNLFDEMLDGMIVINTCRGDVVNEHDLLHGLEIGKISRMGLDVFAKEPLDPKSPLLHHPKVVCTPHIGATTENAFEASSLQAAQKCIDYLEGKTLTDILPYDKPWWNYTFRRS